MDKQSLKLLLGRIQEDNYKVPKDVNAYELSLVMMDYIGDIDSDLRDELILSTLFSWITEGVLPQEETRRLLVIALDEEHLLKGLGNSDDTVFCRTFSAEVVASVISRHRSVKVLSKTDVQNALDSVLKFYSEDLDVRGYVEGKGWAHGAAHGADALDELAGCDEIGYADLKRIMQAIYEKVNINHYSYIHFEDERMVTAVASVLNREIIPSDEIEDWIGSFRSAEKKGTYLENMAQENNVCMFLKSLYFRLIDKPGYQQIADAAKAAIKEISRFGKF